jgi:hypothetical protein
MMAGRSPAPMMFVLCAAGATVVAQQSAGPQRQPLLDGSGYVREHTDGDVPELVPAVGLEAVGRAFAKIIDEVNTLDRNALLPAPTSATAAARR